MYRRKETAKDKKPREFPIYNTHMALLAVVCLFPLFTPYSPEPRFGVGVSQPVSHAEIYRNWAISRSNRHSIWTFRMITNRSHRRATNKENKIEDFRNRFAYHR